MMTYWAVELLGEEVDLAEFERSLHPQFDPCIEIISKCRALRSTTFAPLQSAQEVRDLAVTLIDILNGAVSLVRGSEPVRCGSVYQVGENGSVGITVFATGAAKLRAVVMDASVTVTDKDGNILPPPPPTPSIAQAWVQKALTDDDVADLLNFVGRANNWFDLYKAIEMAEKIVGGERPLQQLVGASAADLKNARSTANAYRHARAYKPSAPATFDYAKSIVKHAVLKALETK